MLRKPKAKKCNWHSWPKMVRFLTAINPGSKSFCLLKAAPQHAGYFSLFHEVAGPFKRTADWCPKLERFIYNLSAAVINNWNELLLAPLPLARLRWRFRPLYRLKVRACDLEGISQVDLILPSALKLWIMEISAKSQIHQKEKLSVEGNFQCTIKVQVPCKFF